MKDADQQFYEYVFMLFEQRIIDKEQYENIVRLHGDAIAEAEIAVYREMSDYRWF